ncbi:unnamed protein product [Musa banksii]
MMASKVPKPLHTVHFNWNSHMTCLFNWYICMSMAPMSCFRYAHDSKDHTSIGILLCAVDVVVRGHAGIVCLVSIDQLLDHLLRLLLLLRVVLLRLLLLAIFLLRLFLRPDRDDVGGPAFPQFAHDVDRIGGADHRHLHLLHVHRDGIDP